MINAGKYNRKIKIINPNPIDRDTDGFKTESEAVILTAWAEVKTVSGITLLKNDTDFEKATVRFTIRHPKVNIERGMWIDLDGDRYKIEYVNDVDLKGIELEMQALKVVK